MAERGRRHGADPATERRGWPRVVEHRSPPASAWRLPHRARRRRPTRVPPRPRRLPDGVTPRRHDHERTSHADQHPGDQHGHARLGHAGPHAHERRPAPTAAPAASGPSARTGSRRAPPAPAARAVDRADAHGATPSTRSHGTAARSQRSPTTATARATRIATAETRRRHHAASPAVVRPAPRARPNSWRSTVRGTRRAQNSSRSPSENERSDSAGTAGRARGRQVTMGPCFGSGSRPWPGPRPMPTA